MWATAALPGLHPGARDGAARALLQVQRRDGLCPGRAHHGADRALRLLPGSGAAGQPPRLASKPGWSRASAP